VKKVEELTEQNATLGAELEFRDLLPNAFAIKRSSGSMDRLRRVHGHVLCANGELRKGLCKEIGLEFAAQEDNEQLKVELET
jgi:hypothetical protein